MRTPHKAKSGKIKSFGYSFKTKDKVKIRQLTNFCKRMPCVLNKLRLSAYNKYAFG